MQTVHPEVEKILKDNGYKCQNLWRLRGIVEEEVIKLLGKSVMDYYSLACGISSRFFLATASESALDGQIFSHT